MLRPPLRDAALAAIFALLAGTEAVVGGTALPPVLHALVAVPATAALAWRRAFPLTVALVLIGANVATNPDGQFATLLAIVVVAYTLGAETEPPRTWFGLGVIAVPYVVFSVRAGLEPSDLAALVVFVAGPAAAGAAVRQRSQRATEAIERAAELERDREAETAAAAAQERVRIARELHDIVSHSISVIAIQTQAVRRRLRDDQQAERGDLEAVETTARQALAEMRRLFGVLRTDGDVLALAPQPGLGDLERLLEQVRAAGLDVRLRIVGDRAALSPGVDLAAYRIVQEGLTNTLRHAGASTALVVLRYGERDLEVVIEDDGVGANGTGGGGHGLVGIRERVGLYGGTVEAGPLDRRGFRLRALLPTREHG
jgi:signal transduction histidine kinase